MSHVVEVRLWGTVIGYLGYSPGQTRIATFEFDEKFAGMGVQVSPITLRHPPLLHSFDNISERTFKGLPGIFADSLPDKYGNQLIDLYMAEKKIPLQSVTALDRLLHVGSRAMGALEYHPAAAFAEGGEMDTALDIKTLSELASMITSRLKRKRKALLNARNRAKALKLIRVGSSAGGARSKALVALSPEGRFKDGTQIHPDGYSYWILKFDSATNSDRDRDDPKGMPRVEYIYSTIAHACGIDMPKIDYIAEGDDFHFLIERFDRVPGAKTEKLHYASWAGLAHTDRDTTGAYSYEQLVLLAREMGLGQDSVTELFRRAVFNIIGRNQDDHTKNFGFLMDKAGEWRLSPAFDMTYAFDPAGKWTKVHQTRLSGKQDGFTREDLLKFGKYCNLSAKKAGTIISTVIDAFSRFPKLARKYEVPKDITQTIKRTMRLGDAARKR